MFPFLVVLICTMGSLILLLVIIARQARLQAAQQAAAAQTELRRDLDQEREWTQTEINEYRHAYQKTEQQLAEARLALGHVEDHARRLRQELARLEATWNELQGVEADGAGRRQQLEAELGRLRAEIAQAEREVAEARRAAQRRASYAVVPYEGPNATHRRPIYIECRADAVVLQPEGVVLGQSDFEGPGGPGNPLDVALRAIREYLLRQQQLDLEKKGEPYPLLLVRPEGVAAYYAARDAMKSWGSEFGYELIGEDWDLDFPPPDPHLAGEVRQAVATARLRQKQLMAAAPGIYGRRSRGGYVASPVHGGLVPLGGSHDESGGGRPHRSFGRRGNQVAPWSDRYGRQSPAPDGAGVGSPTGAHGDSPGAAGAAPQNGGDAPSASNSSGQASGLAVAAGQPECLAKVRGQDWGLPNAARGSVPITSPIRIDCYADRLVLVPERGLGQPKVVPLGPRTQDSIDTLISHVWEYIERWGSAGNGMYWRPVLNVHVAPEGQTRYQDLRILLKGSGLEVERK
jgi:hypothetical protein